MAENIKSVKFSIEVETNKRTIKQDFPSVDKFIDYLLEKEILDFPGDEFDTEIERILE